MRLPTWTVLATSLVACSRGESALVGAFGGLGKRLRIDDHQRCKLTFDAFSGDADVSGTMTPEPGGRFTSHVAFAPVVRHGADPASANAEFDGNRDWPAHPSH
jgi:hypothetical protein